MRVPQSAREFSSAQAFQQHNFLPVSCPSDSETVTMSTPQLRRSKAAPALNVITARFEKLSDEQHTANIRKMPEFDGSHDFVILDMPPALTTLTEEFAEHIELAKFTGIKVFFCDPYSPRQRGTNKNTNGLLRQFFPKGTSFKNVSDEELRAADNLSFQKR